MTSQADEPQRSSAAETQPRHNTSGAELLGTSLREAQEPALRSRARKIARAALGQSLATIWSALLGLFTAPFMIRHLGISSYGVFSLIAIVSGYLTNLELGFGLAAMRFLARARADKDAAREQEVISNSLLIFLPAGCLAFMLTFVGADFIVNHFAHGPARLHSTFLEAVRLGAAIVGLSLLNGLGGSYLQALGRLQLLIRWNWIVSTVASISAVTIVALGGGVIGVLYAQLAISATTIIMYWSVLVRATTARLRPRLYVKTFQSMARFAMFVFVAAIAGEIVSFGPPAILAAYSTTAQLAVLAVPRTVLQQLDGIIGSTSLGFMPYVSGASGRQEPHEVGAMYLANLRLTIVVLAAPIAFVAVFAHALLAAWVGHAFAGEATTPLRVLSIGAFVFALGGPTSDLLRGYDRAGLVTAYTMMTAVVTLAVAFLAVPSQHAVGAAVAITVGVVSATIPFVPVAARLTVGIETVVLLRTLARPIFGLLLAILLYGTGFLIDGAFASAVITGIVGSSIYAVAAYGAVLDNHERAVLRTLVERTTRRSSAGC